MSDKLDEAIQLAKDYLDAHYYKNKITQGDKKRRAYMSEKIRLGGMRLILEQLQKAKGEI